MKWLTLRNLRSKDYDTRAKAVADATRGRDVGALLDVVGDADEFLRSDAIKALGQIADTSAVPALIDRLQDANFNNQEHAAEALTWIGDGRATFPLVAMLRDARTHKQARFAAAKALMTLADAKAVSPLLEALRDPDQLSRFLSLQVLAVVGDARSVPAALAALRDPDFNVQWQAVETLGALRDARAVDALVDLLRRGARERTPSREVIVEALGRIADPRATPALVELLTESTRDLRNAAAAALDAIGWQPTDDASRVRSSLAAEQWDDIVRLGWEHVREPLVHAMKTGDRATRLQAVKAISLAGQREAVDVLIGALADNEDGVACAAAVALAAIGDARATSALIAHSQRYQPAGNYWNDPNAPRSEQSRAEEWVRPLEELTKRAANQMTLVDLHALVGLTDSTFDLRVNYDTPGYGDGADDFTVVRDFSRVRQCAVDELRRRPSR